MDAVLFAACNQAEDFPGGISGMAAAIGKNKFSLAHELSCTGTAKLGLLDAVKMDRRAGTYCILDAYAAECGRLTVPLPQMLSAAGDDSMLDLGRVAKEFADLVKEVTTRASDDDISDNDLEALEREWSELVAAGQQMMRRLRARHEADQARRSHLKVA